MSSSHKNDRFRVAMSDATTAKPLVAALSELGVESTTFGANSQNSYSVPLERWIVEFVEGRFESILFTSAQGVHLVAEMASQLDKRDELMASLAKTHKIAGGKRPSQAL